MMRNKLHIFTHLTKSWHSKVTFNVWDTCWLQYMYYYETVWWRILRFYKLQEGRYQNFVIADKCDRIQAASFHTMPACNYLPVLASRELMFICKFCYNNGWQIPTSMFALSFSLNLKNFLLKCSRNFSNQKTGEWKDGRSPFGDLYKHMRCGSCQKI